MQNNNLIKQKRVFFREAIAIGIILLAIAPICFVYDNLRFDFDCIIWTLLTLIAIYALFEFIYLECGGNGMAVERLLVAFCLLSSFI